MSTKVIAAGAVVVAVLGVGGYLLLGGGGNPMLECLEQRSAAAKDFQGYITDFSACTSAAIAAHPHADAARYVVEAAETTSLYAALGPHLGEASWTIAFNKDEIDHRAIAIEQLATRILPNLPSNRIEASFQETPDLPVAAGETPYHVIFYVPEHFDAAHANFVFTVAGSGADWTIAKVEPRGRLQ